MAHSHRRTGAGRQDAGHELIHFVIEGDGAVVDEPHGCGRGDDLGHREPQERRRGRDADIGFGNGESCRRCLRHTPVGDDGGRESGDAIGCECVLKRAIERF
jgi:hypothetical protein